MTRRRLLVLCAAACCGVFAGCFSNQRISQYEFYEPTKETLHQREDGYYVGALKSETVREGTRNEGDKSFCFGLFNFND